MGSAKLILPIKTSQRHFQLARELFELMYAMAEYVDDEPGRLLRALPRRCSWLVVPLAAEMVSEMTSMHSWVTLVEWQILLCLDSGKSSVMSRQEKRRYASG
jgi:hypothetical protein